MPNNSNSFLIYNHAGPYVFWRSSEWVQTPIKVSLGDFVTIEDYFKWASMVNGEVVEDYEVELIL